MFGTQTQGKSVSLELERGTFCRQSEVPCCSLAQDCGLYICLPPSCLPAPSGRCPRAPPPMYPHRTCATHPTHACPDTSLASPCLGRPSLSQLACCPILLAASRKTSVPPSHNRRRLRPTKLCLEPPAHKLWPSTTTCSGEAKQGNVARSWPRTPYASYQLLLRPYLARLDAVTPVLGRYYAPTRTGHWATDTAHTSSPCHLASHPHPRLIPASSLPRYISYLLGWLAPSFCSPAPDYKDCMLRAAAVPAAKPRAALHGGCYITASQAKALRAGARGE